MDWFLFFNFQNFTLFNSAQIRFPTTDLKVLCYKGFQNFKDH